MCTGVHMVPILNLIKSQGLQDAKQVEESNIDGQAEVNSILWILSIFCNFEPWSWKRFMHISSPLKLISVQILGLERPIFIIWSDLCNTNQRIPADNFCSSIGCLLTWSSEMMSFLASVQPSVWKWSALRGREYDYPQLKITHKHTCLTWLDSKLVV